VSLIELRSLAKKYGAGTNALEALDLTVAAGELLVVLGPSGSGKTTLLRLIAGLEAPSAGSIWIEGRDMRRVPPHQRDVAMVFQSPALYPQLTVYENLKFALRARGVAPDQARSKVNTVAGILGLDSLLNRRPSALSGGERQRVAIGRALVRQPRVILFDEPFSSLDSPLRTGLREQVIELHRRFRTTLVHVTHDQSEALLMGDRVAILDRGRLLQCGTPRTVYDHPADRLVATFVGTPPMNIIPCQVEIEGEGAMAWIRPVATDRTLSWTMERALLPADWDGATRHLDLGLRPEALKVCDSAGTTPMRQSMPWWSGIVRHLEFHGPEVLATLTVGLLRVVARVPSSLAIQERQRVEIDLDLSRAVWFDPRSGAALPSRQNAR
jgi:ABC-type sugar transport system ATPase subunit